MEFNIQFEQLKLFKYNCKNNYINFQLSFFCNFIIFIKKKKLLKKCRF